MNRLPCACETGSFQGSPCLACGAEPVDDDCAVLIGASLLFGAVVVILSVVILRWLAPGKPPCTDPHTGIVYGTYYDSLHGRCEGTP